MHDRQAGVADEVEQLGRRALAVQLGEVGEHAAADRHARETPRAPPRSALPSPAPAGRSSRGAWISGRWRARRRRGRSALRRRTPPSRSPPCRAAGSQGRRSACRSRRGRARRPRAPARRRSASPSSAKLRMVAASCPARGSKWQTRNDGRAFLIRSALRDRVGRRFRPAPRARRAAWRARSGLRSTRRSRGACAGAAAAGAAPCSVSVTLLRELLALLQRVGPGQRQRAHIGLVGGVHPVAVVLHLEGVALHAADDLQPRRDLVGQGADVEEGAGRVDQLRETALLDAAVGVLDGERRADHAVERMQHDEAGAVGDEVAQRLALGGEGQASRRRGPRSAPGSGTPGSASLQTAS